MAPTGSSHINMSLGMLCAAGGAIGYVKAKSVPSVRRSAYTRLVVEPHLPAWALTQPALLSRSKYLAARISATPLLLQLIAGLSFGAAYGLGAYLINVRWQ